MGNDSRARRSVAVIGAGAAGMMAAITAAEWGAAVTVFERNRLPGRKLRITGKGRCNVTNDCSPSEFLESVRTNPKFLYSAAYRFRPEDTMSFFEGLGVPLKTERGRRVFPASDRASDIESALSGRMRSLGVKVLCSKRVSGIIREDGAVTILTEDGGTFRYDSVIVATGGLSYPATGSTGDGHRMLGKLGVRFTSMRPSLVPIETLEDFSPMMGLSLKNVRLTVSHGGKTVFSETGEMLFTHFGVSGPLVLSASSNMHKHPVASYEMSVDLKPALSPEELDARIIKDLRKYAARDFINSLGDLLPQKLIAPVAERSGIPERKKSADITKEERAALAGVLKSFRLTPSGFRPISEAIITSGGIETSELDPKTMELKRFPGIFAAGEIIDVDAYTGGYNLQIAFSTGKLAGEAAARGTGTDKKKTEPEGTRVKDYSKIRVAIDGPSGAGKSTIAKAVAAKTGIIYVDTGALYRTVGLYMAEKGIDAYDTETINGELGNIDIELSYSDGSQHVSLNGKIVDSMIRTETVSYYASAVSKIPEVRAFLLDLQRSLAEKGGVIMDGRDIGTVIIPDAEVKIFLIANIAERARRRYKEQIEKGMDVTYESVLESMTARDEQDSSRDTAPLKPADDAVTLVNDRTIEDAVNFIVRLMDENAPDKADA